MHMSYAHFIIRLVEVFLREETDENPRYEDPVKFPSMTQNPSAIIQKPPVRGRSIAPSVQSKELDLPYGSRLSPTSPTGSFGFEQKARAAGLKLPEKPSTLTPEEQSSWGKSKTPESGVVSPKEYDRLFPPKVESFFQRYQRTVEEDAADDEPTGRLPGAYTPPTPKMRPTDMQMKVKKALNRPSEFADYPGTIYSKSSSFTPEEKAKAQSPKPPEEHPIFGKTTEY